MAMKNTLMDTAAVTLAGVGALNWGLKEFFDLNLVTTIVGMSSLTSIIYGAVAVSGGYLLYDRFVR